MKKQLTYHFVFVMVLLAACLPLSVGASDVVQKSIESVYIRLSEGWWIQVNRDGSGAYGFGTLPAVAQVEPGAFVFSDILEETKRARSRKLTRAETHYMAVSFLQKSASSAEEQRMAKDPYLLANLFETARVHTVTPANEIEKIAYLRIKTIWLDSPPLY